MKDIIEAFNTRVKSPIFGYFIFSWLFFNWKPLALLFFDKALLTERISTFEVSTTIYTLLFLPIVSAVFIAIVSPWVGYVFLWVAQKPTDLKNLIQAKSEHNNLFEKQRLENKRLEEQAVLIDKVKETEKEISSIKDEKLKEKMKGMLIQDVNPEEVAVIVNNVIKLAEAYALDSCYAEAQRLLDNFISENMENPMLGIVIEKRTNIADRWEDYSGKQDVPF